MTVLICNICYQIPHIEFLPGLMIKFSCCKEILIPHFDLDEIIKINYTLMCSKSCCSKNNQNFHFISGSLICEECLNKLKINKNKINNEIKEESIPLTCKSHYKKYIYYEESRNFLLYCNECNWTDDSKKINDFKKEIKIENLNINEKSINIYLLSLFKHVKKTYEIYQSKIPNSYLNYIHLKEYLDNYNIISPFCPECKTFYNININKNKINEEYNPQIISETPNNINLEVKCQCGSKDNYSINQIEARLNSVTCFNCNEIFAQNRLFYDSISQNIICEECLKIKKFIDYIRFNEIGYICSLHRFKFEYYCGKCQQLFCRNCINLNYHQYKNLSELPHNQNYEKEFQNLYAFKWLIKFKNNGYLNLTNSDINCIKFNNDEKNKKFQELVSLIEGNKKGSFDITVMKKENSIKSIMNRIENIMLYNKMFGNNLEIANLNDKINTLELSIIVLLKELNDKNKLVHLLRIRNIFQHLIFNIIKINYNSFNDIEPNFKILYESYKYLKYELKYKDKENEIKNKIESIFAKIEDLIKNKIKNNFRMNIMKKFKEEMKKMDYDYSDKIIKAYFTRSEDLKDNFDFAMNNQLPKIHFNKKTEIFNNVFENGLKKVIDNEVFSTLKKYNTLLLKHDIINKDNKKKGKFNEFLFQINSIENNKVPENYETSSLNSEVNLIGKFYLDKYGYTNDKSFNSNLLCQVFENEKEDYNHQYLSIKKTYENDFLKKMKCDNDTDFYFLFNLINNIINKIGKIIHQNDEIYKIYFSEISDKLDYSKYQLKKDNNENNTIILIDKNEKNESISYLSNKVYNYEDFINFSNTFYEKNKNKIKELLGDKKEKEIIKEIEKLLKNNIGKNKSDLEKEKLIFMKLLNEAIIFHENYKNLFLLFPMVKNDINDLINKEDMAIVELENITKIETQNEGERNLINIFIKNYALIMSLRKIMEDLNNATLNYDNIFKKIYELKYKEILFDLYKKKLDKEKNVEELFVQERNDLIKVFESQNIMNKEKLSKKKNPKLENEIAKYASTIEKMKEIKIQYIEESFKDYFNFNITSFANTKFDVALYLYQNKYI